MKAAPALLIRILAALLLAGGATRADVVMLVSNEQGSSVTQFDITTGVKTTYFSGLNHPDGLAFGLDGLLYATSFGTTTSNGSLVRVTGAASFSTLASGFNGSGALVRDAAGSFYVPNFGVPSGGGTTLSKVAPNGGGGYTTTTLASGLSTPDGVAFDSHGILYEADFGSNAINKIDTSSGTVTPFVSGALSGLNHPSALVFDSQDNLYVANYQNGTVSKITTGGVVTNNFATGLGNPLGLLLDEAHGTFYATNWTGGTVSSFAFAGGGSAVISSGFNGPTHMVFLTVPEPSASLLVACGCLLLTVGRRVRGDRGAGR